MIEVPFELRHRCWFCGEPCNRILAYPAASHSGPELAVPACQECLLLAKATPLTSLYECRSAVKDGLMRRYTKHLAIGLNWTEAELQQADFTCKTLQSFQRSAWFMYEVAKDRLNFPGWAVVVDGVPLQEGAEDCHFNFDGIRYPSLFTAIGHYSSAMALDKTFLCGLVAAVGKNRFGYALRLARIHITADARYKRQVIQELLQDNQDLIS